MKLTILNLFAALLWVATAVQAQESPYFVTYDHHLEEPGNMEIEAATTTGVPRQGQNFFTAPYVELEYGVTARWTSELYLESQSTWADSTVFTGWRFENRFRPLKREHWINPVLYLEYEDLSEASRIQKEIVGTAPDLTSPNRELQPSKNRELETKLILSSNVHDWNLAGNFIVEKNFSQSEGLEFGYAVGFYRPLATMASSSDCRFCRENFAAGAELYGGLGSTLGFGLHDTAHYIAPVVAWQISDSSSLRFSPGIGLTHQSSPVLLRFGYSYEIRGFGDKVKHFLGGH